MYSTSDCGGVPKEPRVSPTKKIAPPLALVGRVEQVREPACTCESVSAGRPDSRPSTFGGGTRLVPILRIGTAKRSVNPYLAFFKWIWYVSVCINRMKGTGRYVRGTDKGTPRNRNENPLVLPRGFSLREQDSNQRSFAHGAEFPGFRQMAASISCI